MVGRRSKLAPLGKTSISRFTERFSWAGNRPGRQGTYFLFTDNFFTMSSPATYIRSHSAPLVSADFPPAPGKSRPRGKFGRQCQLLVTNFSPLTFDLLVTNGHSSEQGSMWDHGQPDDCVCETFCAARTPSFQEAVSKRALIRLLLPFRETFLFVDDTKTLHPQFLLAQCQLWWAILGNGHWAMNNGQLGIWHIVANCR